MELSPTSQQLGTPGFSDCGLIAGFQAVDEGGRHGRTLLGREPEDVFEHMVYAGIHRAKSSRPPGSHGHLVPAIAALA